MAIWLNDTFTEAVSPTALTSHTSDSGASWVFWAGTATSPGVYTTAGGVVASGAATPQVYRASVIAPAADVSLDWSHYAAATGTVASVGVCGRLDAGATAGYMAVYQQVTSKWTIYRLGSSLSATLLAESAVYALSASTSYAVEFDIEGSGATVTLTVRVNGVSVASYADTSGSRVTAAGYAGVWFYTPGGAASQAYIGSLSAEDIASAVASITSAVPDGRIFKHSGSTWAPSNTGSIVETGTYANFTPNQVRLVEDGTNTPLTGFDWTTITTATGGSYAHTFTNVPQGVGTGWYNVQFRDSAVPATIVATGKRGVGMHIGHYGQSQSANQFDNYPVVGSALTPTGMSRVHGGQTGAGTIWTWATLDATKNSAIIAADILLNSLTGGKIPMAHMHMGFPGTSLVRGGPNGNWLPTSGAKYQYGKNLVDGLEGTLDAIVDIRGESDANEGTVTQAEFYAGLGTLYTQTRTDFGADIPIIQVMLGRTSSAYWTDASGEAIKKAQVQMESADANVYRVESYDGALHTDGLHRNTNGCEAVARRWAMAIADVFGLTTAHRSPHIASVAQVSSTVYDITFTHELGTDFTPTSAITGLRFTDSVTTSVLTATTVVRQAANKIRATLSGAPSNMPKVAVAYGANPTTNFADNSTLALPLEYNDGVTATALATTVTITFENRTGTLRSGLSSMKWAFFDQTNPGSFVAPTAQGTAETTDGSGVMVLTITGTSLAPGATGWLIVTNSDGTVNDDDYTFSGPVVVA